MNLFRIALIIIVIALVNMAVSDNEPNENEDSESLSVRVEPTNIVIGENREDGSKALKVKGVNVYPSGIDGAIQYRLYLANHASGSKNINGSMYTLAWSSVDSMRIPCHISCLKDSASYVAVISWTIDGSKEFYSKPFILETK
jgi:hypothetical protein